MPFSNVYFSITAVIVCASFLLLKLFVLNKLFICTFVLFFRMVPVSHMLLLASSFYSHQRPHTATRSPMSMEIGPKACISVARGQTWQGHASCLNKTQLVGSLIVPTFLHQCNGSPAVG